MFFRSETGVSAPGARLETWKCCHSVSETMNCDIHLRKRGGRTHNLCPNGFLQIEAASRMLISPLVFEYIPPRDGQFFIDTNESCFLYLYKFCFDTYTSLFLVLKPCQFPAPVAF